MYTILIISIIFQLYLLYKNNWKLNSQYFVEDYSDGKDISPQGCLFIIQIIVIAILIIIFLP